MLVVPLLKRKDAKNYYLGCIQNPKIDIEKRETFSFLLLRAFSRRHLHHHHQRQHVDNISFFIQQQQFLRLRDCDDDEVFDYFATKKSKRVVLERVLYFEFFSFHVFFPKRRRVFVFDEGEWLSRCVFFFFFFFFSREKEEFYELPHQLLLWLEQNEQRSVRSIDGFALLARENLRGKRFGTDDEFHEG